MMLSRPLLGLCLAWAALIPGRAQYGVPGGGVFGVIAPTSQTIASADGTFELDVRESAGEAMEIESSSVVSLRRGGNELWSRDLAIAVMHGGVSNHGWITIVGVGRGEFESKAPRLVVLMLDVRGATVMSESRTLVRGNSPDSAYFPICGGVLVLEVSDTMLVRLSYDHSSGSREEWRIHDARGEHCGTIAVAGTQDESDPMWFVQDLIPIQRGQFVVSSWLTKEWVEDPFARGNGVMVHDLRDLDVLGDPLWSQTFPADGTELSVAPAMVGKSAGAGLSFRRGEAVERFRFLDVDVEGTVTLRRPGDEAEAGD